MSTEIKPDHVKKIGVVMLGLLGDVLMRTPVLRELRKAFPKAQIICIVDPIGAEVLRLTSLADQVLITNRSKTSRVRYILEKIALFWRVRCCRFDVAIDLYGGKTGEALVNISQATCRFYVEFSKVRSNPNFPIKHQLEFKNPFHLTNPLLRVSEYFEYEDPSVETRPFLNTKKIESSVSKDLLSDVGLSGQPFVLISLGSGDPEKIPPLKPLTELLKFFSQTHGLNVAIVRNPGQEFLQSDLNSRLNEVNVAHTNLSSLQLAEIAYLMARAKLCILPDSGLFHLAVGVGAATLGVFTHTNPELVRPNTSRVEFCYREDSTKQRSHLFDLPHGSRNLNADELITACEKLLERIKGD
jgi:ADP-heptose:LPS heptosyltransferase